MVEIEDVNEGSELEDDFNVDEEVEEEGIGSNCAKLTSDEG